MKIKYKVHSIAPDEFSAMGMVGEREMPVKIPGVVIELLSEDGAMCHTFRIPGIDAEGIAAMATPGTSAEIEITFGTPVPLVVPDHTAEFAVHEEIAKAIEEGREPPPMPGYEPVAAAASEVQP